MPYEHINHHEFPHDLNPANPNISPTTLSVQQMETVLDNWGILTIWETIYKMKNDNKILVNKAQLVDIENFVSLKSLSTLLIRLVLYLYIHNHEEIILLLSWLPVDSHSYVRCKVAFPC